MLYALENLIYPKTIHLCAGVYTFFLLNNYLCRSSIKWSFLYLRVSSIQRLYTSMRVFFKFLDAWASQEPTMSVTLSHFHTVRFSLLSLPLQPLDYVWHPLTTPHSLWLNLTPLYLMTLSKCQKCQKWQKWQKWQFENQKAQRAEN